MAGTESRFGELLRDWRAVRRRSQLALALDANVSARHVSFIESGRARPSRAMVLQLADALDVPLRERNALLHAAGFAPVYRESTLDEPEMRTVRQALDHILARQEPHPAVVMDRHWNIVRTNVGARDLFGRLIDLSEVPPPANVLRLMFDPGGLRPWVENWDEVAVSLLVRADREAVGGAPGTGLRTLLDEIARFPGVPARRAPERVGRPLLPVIPVHFRRGAFRASYFSTVTTLGTAQDVTLQEIRIECFFPAAPD